MGEISILIPDLFALLTSAFWGPAALWLSTSLLLPLMAAWFFNFTEGGRNYDPLSYNVTKALLAWVVYVRGGVGGSSRGVVEKGVPGGSQGLLIGAGIGVLASLYEAVLKRWNVSARIKLILRNGTQNRDRPIDGNTKESTASNIIERSGWRRIFRQIFFSLTLFLGVSGLDWGLFEFPGSFFFCPSPPLPFCAFSLFLGVGFLYGNQISLSGLMWVPWRGRREVNWGGGCNFFMVFEIKTPQVYLWFEKIHSLPWGRCGSRCHYLCLISRFRDLW